MQIVKIDLENIGILNSFLNSSSKLKKNFRYFTRRDVNVIQHHLCTLMLVEDEVPVCYGHLDPEGEVVWLGIAVADDYVGKKWGSKMMSILIQEARDLKISVIHLTVDNDNLAAIALYEKSGFKLVSKKENISTYSLIT